MSEMKSACTVCTLQARPGCRARLSVIVSPCLNRTPDPGRVQPRPPPATQLLDSSHINREKVEPSVGILFIFKNIAIICPGGWRWRCRHCCLLEAAPVQLQLQGHASCAAIVTTSCCSAAVSPLECNNTSPDTVR